MLSAPVRVTAPANVFVGELFRQPWLLLIVIFGPFLILLAFVLGARVYRDFPSTIIVQPPAEVGTLPLQVGARELDNFLQVKDVTSDRDAALARLHRGEVKLVLELPPDPQAALRQGQQAQIRLYTNEIDPVARSFFTLYVESQIAELNRQTIAKSAAQAQQGAAAVQGDLDQLQRTLDGINAQDVAEQRRRLAEARRLLAQVSGALAQVVDAAQRLGVPAAELQAQQARVRQLDGDLTQMDSQLALVPGPDEMARLRQGLAQLQPLLAQLRSTNPDILSAPFSKEVINTAPYLPEGTSYFLPGILALVLQHLALTLAAVSIARDRRLGMMDLYRLAPASSGEVMLGKYIGLSMIVALITAVVTTLALLALGVPVLGGAVWLVAALTAFLLTALAMGFVVGLLTRSEETAIQAAMLLLIASVAFGGLLAPLEQLTLPMRVVAFLLPVTSGKILLEAVMFRGYLLDWTAPVILGGLLLTLLVLSFWLFRRELAERTA